MIKIKEKLVEITFLDHSMSDGTDLHPIHCKVVGWLIGEDRSCYYIASWVCDGEVNNSNTECFVIVKHRGLKIRSLK